MAAPLKENHWAAQNERGNRFFLNLTVWMVRYCPGWVMRVAVSLVATYYYLTSPKARRHVAQYQRRLRREYGTHVLPEKGAVRQQFTCFAEAITDRFAVWQKKLGLAQVDFHCEDELERAMHRPKPGERGQILLCSHLGNVEITRALSASMPNFKLNVLIHSRHAQVFNQALHKAGADDVRVMQVTELDAAVMLQLSERVEAGEWLAIAADRVPVRGEKIVHADFLGDTAAFAQGPWLLAGLLGVPVNTLFCLKQRGRYQLYIERFSPQLQWSRSTRCAVIGTAAQRYADILGQYCAQAPLQWFNFYDFWQDEHNEH